MQKPRKPGQDWQIALKSNGLQPLMSDTKKAADKISGLALRTSGGGAHAGYSGGETLTDMIKEDRIAERIAIETYSETIRSLGDDDCNKIEHHDNRRQHGVGRGTISASAI